MSDLHAPPSSSFRDSSTRLIQRLGGLHKSGPALLLLAIATVGLGGWLAIHFYKNISWFDVLPVLVPALLGAGLLLAKSLMNFSQTGPRIREEIATHYRGYTLFALARLCVWALVILCFLGGIGVFLGYLWHISFATAWGVVPSTAAAVFGMIAGFMFQFSRKLRHNPGLLQASLNIRVSRLYRMWTWFTPSRLAWVEATCLAGALSLFFFAIWQLNQADQTAEVLPLTAAILFFTSLIILASWEPEARTAHHPAKRPKQPNILMIGSDTLRADRLGGMGYHRALTPNIDALALQGTHFTNCYVPCGRTAPSIISLLTGTWPHTHGIRDNYCKADETLLNVDTLPRQLKTLGYQSAVISDWAGADMGKFSFGFDYLDLPEDQWNLKYLIRQGPKDLRLFVSLFTHNRLGRWLLPELYYLGGVPLTQPLGKRARKLVSRLAEAEAPFFLNIFYSSTHPPFASEWPWYTRYSDPAYAGESKFAIARLTEPFEIIRRQGEPREEFDLDQIVDLYDGCVAEFDHEVGKMVAHLQACGISNDTIVVVYSDHGMEFFEQGSWGLGNSAVSDASPRVPLVIRDPRQPSGGRVDKVVRTIDLAPTLLELAGGAPTPLMEGVSLAGCLRGHPCPELDAFNETGIWVTNIPGLPEHHLRYPNLMELLEVPDRQIGMLAVKDEYFPFVLSAKDRMLRRGKWKLVYQPLTEGYALSLFDLEIDPDCGDNLAEKHPDIRDQLWESLFALLARDPFGAKLHQSGQNLQ